MFRRTRRQLTILYTVLTALALGGFALIFYFGFEHLLMHEQERELEAYLLRESRIVREILKHESRTRGDGDRDKQKQFRAEEAYVVFAVTPGGAILVPENQVAGLQPPPTLLNSNYETQQPEIHRLDRGTAAPERYLWRTLAIQEEGKSRGRLIIGRSLSLYDHFLFVLAQALGASSFVFLAVSGAVGHFAAGRAISPIRRSFDTQRRFAADASHELRTPLSVIQASLDVLEKEEGEGLSPLSRQIFDDLKDEVRRMTRLTGDLLTLARSDSDGLELVRESFDGVELARGVVRNMRSLAELRGVALALSTHPPCVFYADKDRIAQLMMILLDNAIKFTPSGGQAMLTLGCQNDTVVLEVADTGIGLSREDRQLVFERFFRVDKARSRENGGAGLGLSIAAWIVKAHGGSIAALENTNGGSVFRVVLPQRG